MSEAAGLAHALPLGPPNRRDSVPSRGRGAGCSPARRGIERYSVVEDHGHGVPRCSLLSICVSPSVYLLGVDDAPL
jgi:hypothetical protein